MTEREPMPTEISATKQTPRCWRVTFNGHVLGDSRGYYTKAEAMAAAHAIVQANHRQAARECRHADYVLRPSIDRE